MSTNTNMATPTCENCGRDKTATYICDGCCDKLNDAARKRASDYAALEAERDEWKRRCEAIVEMLKPAPDEKLQKMYAEDLHVEYALREFYPQAIAIAEGRDNG